MSKNNYVPDRRDIVWMNFDPSLGKEIGKYRPALVLSSKKYNWATNLLICCPISTSIKNTPTEVPINILDKPSVIATSLIYTFAYKERKVKLITKVEAKIYREVLERFIPLIGVEEFLSI